MSIVTRCPSMSVHALVCFFLIAVLVAVTPVLVSRIVLISQCVELFLLASSIYSGCNLYHADGTKTRYSFGTTGKVVTQSSVWTMSFVSNLVPLLNTDCNQPACLDNHLVHAQAHTHHLHHHHQTHPYIHASSPPPTPPPTTPTPTRSLYHHSTPPIWYAGTLVRFGMTLICRPLNSVSLNIAAVTTPSRSANSM